MATLVEQLAPFAAPAATFAAAVTAGVAGYLAGGWKLREVRVAYEQRIRDSYIENARKVSGDVYIPLAIALSGLTNSYSEFAVHIDFATGIAPPGAVNRFKGSCNQFRGVVDGLLARGASAYLTLQLEEYLSDFVLFLNHSQAATKVTKQTVLSPRFYGYSTSEIKVVSTGMIQVLSWAAIALKEFVSVIVPFGGIDLAARVETIASPLASREFETRFRQSALTISRLIKEVTLGSRHAVA